MKLFRTLQDIININKKKQWNQNRTLWNTKGNILFRRDKRTNLNCLCSTFQSSFQLTVEKPKPKQLLRQIRTGTNSAMNQSQFLAIICNSLEAREKSRVHGAYMVASHWLKNSRESFKPITTPSNRNNVIPFDSHLKTALNKMKTILL